MGSVNLFLQPHGRPLIIAHRGSSAHAPENTLIAFQLAVEQGADAIELDVDLTRDGHVLVIHDATIDRTTDGEGRVNDLTVDEIQRVDAGAWFDREFARERVPLLEKVLATLGQRVLIDIEVKSAAFRSNGVEAKVVALIKRHDLIDRVIVSSFNPVALMRIKRGEPRIACGLLYAPAQPFYLRRAWLARFIPHLDARHPHYSQITPPVVRRIHAQGQKINTWTVNDAAPLRAMAEVGVDGIIGDDPVLMRETLRARQITRGGSP